MPTADKSSLHNMTVLVTRPEIQAQTLVAAIEQNGGQAIRFSLLDIQPCAEEPAAFARIEEFDLLIFVSRPAARYCWKFLPQTLPSSVKVAVIGSGTRDELLAQGCKPDYIPYGQYDSTGLLDLAALRQIEGKRVLIVRGQSGREELADGLRQRGASVSYAQVYTREPSKQALTRQHLECQAIVITSGEALAHLYELAEQAGLLVDLLGRQLVAIHRRLAGRATALGFTLEPWVAPQASDDGLLNALLSLAAAKQDTNP